MLVWHRAAPWLAVIGGSLAALAATISDFPGWVAVVFLLLGVAAGGMAWLAARRAPLPTYSFQGRGYWQDWLSGWYWETDADHRLVVLKPDEADSAAWHAARKLIHAGQPWWACWPPCPDDAQSVALTVLEMRLKSGLPIDMSNLPGPLDEEVGPDTGQQKVRCWQIIGAPRLDEQGRFAGHHGVWRPLRPAATEAAPAEATSASGPLPMTESDQEVLRYALSHDLRAPLRVVDGFSRIIKEDYGRLLDRIGNDHLDRVLAATARMNGMIDAILAQAQLSHAPLQRARMDLTAMAREVAQEQRAARHADLAGMTQTALLEVEFSIAEGLMADGDPVLVRRVLENLIGNALKYSGKVPHPRIEIGAVAATNPTVYFVRDNGAGFDMRHADKLFGLFQRLHSTRDFPGTGVGLAGVQNIVRRHGGRVWAEAAPGQGACFYFTLLGAQ